MGSCMSSIVSRDGLEFEKYPEEKQQLEPVKILILGAGESGKSTVLKQLRMIYKGRMTAQDLRLCTEAIRKNAVECMQAVLQAMTVYGIQLDDESKASARTTIVTLPENAPFTKNVANCISSLWQDKGVQLCYEKRDLYWLLDGAAYYFNEVQRIASTDYEPTEEDVIMTRVRTTGMDSIDFAEPPYCYSMVDVGGQRNERRKWIHCFENVNAVVFLVGLSGYNQCLFEDASVNRMHESLKLFKQVVSNPIFKDTPVFLFLNKRDLFEKMISKNPLKTCFPDYTGPERDMHSALKHIEKAFSDAMHSVCPSKKIFIQVVAALNREDVKKSFTEIKDILHFHYGDAEKHINLIKTKAPEISTGPLRAIKH